MNLLKSLIIFLSIFAVISAADEEEDSGMSADEIASALLGFTDGCEMKPEKEHALEVIKFTKDAQLTSKCFRYCLMLQFDLIAEGATQMNKDKAIEGMSMIFTDGNEHMEAIIDECNAQNAGITDKCENAHAHGICIYDKVKEKGLKMPELKD